MKFGKHDIQNDLNATNQDVGKKKKKIRWWHIVVIVLVIALLGKACSGSGGTKTTPENQSQTSGQQGSATKETEKVYAANNDSLKQLFTDTLTFKQEGLTALYDEANKSCVISYYPTYIFYNESDYVKEGVSSYIKYCQNAFKIEGVTSVEFNISMQMKDSYGNLKVEKAMTIKMTKENFDKFNWKNLAYQNIYDNFVANCENFWVHPGILKNVDKSKVFYAP